jgi:peroxiredoxin
VDDGGAQHLKPGMALPSVTLPSTRGTEIDVAALPGRSLLIVYPWTGRPGQPNPPDWDDVPGAHGSTPELKGFRDRHAAFARLGLTLFGLSRQTTAYQRELAARLAFTFPILSDEGGLFAGALLLPSFTTAGRGLSQAPDTADTGWAARSGVLPGPHPPVTPPRCSPG